MSKSRTVAKDTGFTKEFTDAFSRQARPDDHKEDAEQLAIAVSAISALAAQKKRGQCKIQVFNPKAASGKGMVPHTAIAMVNDDMPFIIDSVVAELGFQGLNIDKLLHPILHVLRDKDGALREVGAIKDSGRLTESYVYIRLEQMLSSEACHNLEAALQSVFADVRAATQDWPEMIALLDEVTDMDAVLKKVHDPGDVREAQEFLRYLKANNFTFLGYRSYRFTGTGDKAQSAAVKDSALGVLKRRELACFGRDSRTPEVPALRRAKWPVMICKLIDEYATVHRHTAMDAICVKIVDAKGAVTGMHLFVGLFTSSTYTCRTSDVPIVRQKVRETMMRAGFTVGSHDCKALENVLEKMPRDELFQTSADDLYDIALGILELQIKQRISIFIHRDVLGQHLSCLVYVPRDLFNTRFRVSAARLIEENVHGKVANYFTTLDDSPLARILFTVRLEGGNGKAYDREALEAQLVELGREWDERLRQVLVDIFGKIKGTELTAVYGRSFSRSYQEMTLIKNVVHDIRHLEAIRHEKGSEDIRVDIYRTHRATTGALRLKVYHNGAPVPLSDILPMLENMGLKALSEMPYEVKPMGRDNPVWIHDFELEGPPDTDLDKVKNIFEDAFLQIWRRRAENDGLNRLILLAGLSWSEIRIIRTYGGFMRQARVPYSRVYIEQVLGLYPHIARSIVDLFMALHDPAVVPRGAKKADACGEKILTLLQDVQKLDHDRILRMFKTLIEKTLRTNYFQTDDAGLPPKVLAVKMDSQNIAELPLPRPQVEIFVYSSRVEAVHLRGGKIARGGIRWSDRHEDFRTEVLGLLKSQMVKNTVIVPVGAKGGFIVKLPPKEGGRAAMQKEGIECYKLFVQALLDITDNNVKGKVVRPRNVVCHDDEDPYLVVAADKGTATFSDIANELSLKSGFWLGDAFASGGSAGYDHKKMGITARGGWESVRRHFRELGKNIDKEPFTMAGIGDMAGDVFGNGVLLSKVTKLVGAFNHLHIFCDPDPDMAVSFAERQRLFNEGGSWDAYDQSKLSAGGAVFDRSAKSLKLTPQIKKCFGISQDHVTPDDLIRAILMSDVEALWFGGIGTFVKSSRQSHADADDKSNDAVRVDASELRAKVIGEGANMGMTQAARIEFARHGGRLNTDFIDNSAGVDCSDHEVNIKILLSDVMARSKMTLAQRDKLLVEMTDSVADLVLKDNYQQTQSLSAQLWRAPSLLGVHARLIRSFETAGLMKRSLEGLPDDEALALLERDGLGLTRPELSILTSYAKIVVYKQILASAVPDDPAVEWLLVDYFPKALHKYMAEIKSHKLRREIIATQIVNLLVNRMGPAFVDSRMAKTGASAEDVIKAFMITMNLYGLPEAWRSIEALDNKVPAEAQISALNDLFQVVKRAVTWFLRFGGKLDISTATEMFKPGIMTLKKSIRSIAPEDVQKPALHIEKKLAEWGVPAGVTEEIATVKLLASASDIVNIARKADGDVKTIAGTYFQVGEYLRLDWLRVQTATLQPSSSWQARVISGLTDDFYIHQAALTAAIVGTPGKKSGKAAKSVKNDVENWFEGCREKADKILQLVRELEAQQHVTLEMLMLVSQRIGQLTHSI